MGLSLHWSAVWDPGAPPLPPKSPALGVALWGWAGSWGTSGYASPGIMLAVLRFPEENFA